MRQHLALALFCIPILMMASPTVDVSPNPIYVGEHGSVIIKSDNALKKPIRFTPVEGLLFLKDSVGHVPRSTLWGQPFTVVAAGTYQLPSITVTDTSGNKHSVTVPEITAKDNGIGRNDVFMEVAFGLKTAYVGQAVPVSVEIWIADSLLYSRQTADFLSPLKLNIEPAQWRLQAGATSDTRVKTGVTSRAREGKDYSILTFDGVCFPKTTGPLSGTASHLIPILIEPESANKFASIFSAAPRRTVYIPVEDTFDELPVSTLPGSPPANTYALGLIGDLTLNVWTDKTELFTDDLVTLTLSVTGTGNREHIQVPDLKLEGWTVYSPNVEPRPDQQRVDVSWLLQPNSANATLPELAFSYFSLAQNSWVTKQFTKELSVTAVDAVVRQEQLSLAPVTAITLNAAPALVPPIAIGLFLAGPALLLVLLLIKATRQEPKVKEFDRRKRDIIHKLKGGDADLAMTLSMDLLPALRALYDLPPGASLDRIQPHLNDDELGDLLERLHPESYRPDPSTMDRQQIINRLSRFRPMLLLVFMLPFVLGAASAPEPATAYLAGDYPKAVNDYKAVLAKTPRLSSLVNLGNSYYMNNDYVKALLCAERALRIDPRHERAVSLQNLCLQKLVKPRPVWIRYLSPGEWMTVAGGLWLLAWIIGITGWRQRRVMTHLSLVILLSGAFAAGVIAYKNHTTTWNPSEAMVIYDVELSPVPETSEKSGVMLMPTQMVDIVDQRPGWVKVSSPTGTGWLPDNSIGRLLLPPGRSTFNVL